MAETWKKQVATEFEDIVRRAVEPFRKGEELEGDATIDLARVAVRYSAHNPAKWRNNLDGVGGLGFVPRYDVRLALFQRDRELGNPDRHNGIVLPEELATFGLYRKSLQRVLARPDTNNGQFYPLPPQDLDQEQSEALIDFIRTPHLSHHALAIVMAHTPGDDKLIAIRTASENEIRWNKRRLLGGGDNGFRQWADGLDRQNGRW